MVGSLPVSRVSIHSDLPRLRRALFAAAGLSTACYVGDMPVAHQVPAQDGDGDESSLDPGTSTGDDEPVDPAFACDSPQAILQLSSGGPSGFVRCADGLIHRVDSVAADEPTFHMSPCVDPGDGAGCLADSDCTLDPHGMCLQRNDTTPSHDPAAYCFCDYGCETDDDCSLDGYVCAPVGVVEERGRCIPANCVSDDDCESKLCTLTLPMPEDVCYGTPPHEGGELLCKTPQDECRIDSDCPEEPEPGADYVRCQGLVHYERFVCNSLTCQDPGRPFVVDGVARVAELVAGRGWSGATKRVVEGVDDALRSELGAYWARVGALEHASVASFARATLWLMAVGAPADLIEASLAAGQDEVEHARLTFALAEAYGAVARQPGPLAIERSLDDLGIEALVVHTIDEACINETLAALEAREACLGCVHESPRRALEQIAADEFRHAALGWRIVAWALEQRPGLHDLVAHTFARGLAAVLARRSDTSRIDNLEPDTQTLREHGVMTRDTRDQLALQAVRDVLEPAVVALLAGPVVRNREGAALRLT